MEAKKMPYAEDINYWKTSQTSPDTWIDKTIKVIQQMKGKVLGEAFGSDASGLSAFMLAFEIEGQRFKVVWPVLPSKTGNSKAARIQAATLLYHDIKARCLSASVLGVRPAFFAYLMLPDGRTAGQASLEELAHGIPAMFKSPMLEGMNE